MKRSFKMKALLKSLVESTIPTTQTLIVNTENVTPTTKEKLIILPNINNNDPYYDILEFINSATTSLDICIYSLYDKRIEDALIKLRRENKIFIRILIPWQYNKGSFKLYKNLASLKSEGINIHFSPLHFYNTHAKFMIIDKKKCMIMDFNFDYDYITTTRGFGFITDNQNDVDQLKDVFNYDINQFESSSLVSPLAPPPPPPPPPSSISQSQSRLVWSPSSKIYNESLNGILQVYDIIDNAKYTLDIYIFVLTDKKIQDKIIDAARRKVKVRIIFNDLTSNITKLVRNKMLSAGIEMKYYDVKPGSIDRNDPSNPNLYMHSKSMIRDVKYDTNLAYISSLNFNYASIHANRELGIIIKNKNIANQMSETFNVDWNSKNAKSLTISSNTTEVTTDTIENETIPDPEEIDIMSFEEN